MQTVLIILAIVALLYFGIKAGVAAAERARERERLRLEGLAQWSSANGYQFSVEDYAGLVNRFNGMADIGRGHAHRVFEVVSRHDPAPVWVFRLYYRTWETRTVSHRDSKGRLHTRTERYEAQHWRQYLIVELGARFPSFSLREEHWGDKLAGFIGFDDIDFESEAFSRRYFVKSADKQFAYALIHPQMMEWLMEKKLAAMIERGLWFMDLGGEDYGPELLQSALELTTGFINRIPEFVWHDYGGRQPLRLPEPHVIRPAGFERQMEVKESV